MLCVYSVDGYPQSSLLIWLLQSYCIHNVSARCFVIKQNLWPLKWYCIWRICHVSDINPEFPYFHFHNCKPDYSHKFPFADSMRADRHLPFCRRRQYSNRKDTVQEMSAGDGNTRMWQVMKSMDRSRKPFQPRTLKGFANMSDRKTADCFL